MRSNRMGTPGFLPQVEEAVWAVNPNLPLLGARALEALVAASMAHTSFAMILMGLAGVVAGIGVVAGPALAVATTRLMSSVLFGVDPVDVPTFAAVATGLFAVAAVASYLPGRRAAGVDPVEALRAE